MKTAFYIYDNMRLKEISILKLFEQIKENTVSGSAFSARLGSSAVAFIPDPRKRMIQQFRYAADLIDLEN